MTQMLNGMISIVVSVYNEEAVLNAFMREVYRVIEANKILAEIVFVNDGSTDNSFELLKSLQNSYSQVEIKVINFSRNFGHEAAMIAGIDHAAGEAVVCMDADLQHPPALLPEMIACFQRGADIVNMIRERREDNGWLKNKLSAVFYRMINRLSEYRLHENASDFFLISRKVANVLQNNFRERNRFLRGFIQIVGFSNTTLNFVAPKRDLGESKYSFIKLLILSMNAVISFSKAPLYLGLYIGLFFALISILLTLYTLIVYFFGNTPPSGYTTIVIFMGIGFSIMFFLIGIIGVYVGYNFEENKKRPVYIIDEIV